MIKRVVAIVAAGALMASSVMSAAGAGNGPGTMATRPAARTMATWTWERTILFPVGHSGVTGMAYFTYSFRTGMSTVQLTVRNLKPFSTHPAHIHRGRCGSNGPVLYPFPNLVANRLGVGTATTRFRGQFAHRPWSIMVHAGAEMGMSMGSMSMMVVACGNVL